MTPEEKLAYNAYWNFYHAYVEYPEWRIYFVAYILGVIGSILILFTLMRSKELSEPCFICYQAIAWMELIYCAVSLPMMWDYISGYYYEYYVYGFRWYLINFYYAVTFCLNCTICGLMSFLSIQRTVASLIPAKFNLVEGKRLCIGFTVIFLLFNIGIWAPEINSNEVYRKDNNSTYTTKSYQYWKDYKPYTMYYRLALTVILTVTTVTAIIGMIKATVIRFDK